MPFDDAGTAGTTGTTRRGGARTRPSRAFTPEQDAAIAAMRRQGMAWQAIADALGRPDTDAASVRQRGAKLRRAVLDLRQPVPVVPALVCEPAPPPLVPAPGEPARLRSPHAPVFVVFAPDRVDVGRAPAVRPVQGARLRQLRA